jgi:hypothetical protein
MMNPIRLSRGTAPDASLFVLHLFLALVLLGGALWPAAVLAGPRYNLGSVPDQTVWSGSSREFSLHWDNRSGVVMLLEATPTPTGLLTLEPLDDTDWRFEFTPAVSDVTPFQVVVTALEGGQQTSQLWEMAPQAMLPPETDFFGSGPHTQAPIPPYGVTVFDQTDPVPASLNYEQQDLHRVRVVGEIVEIEAGHSNGLYEAYFDGTRRDLLAMEIIAERVVFRSAARLRQTAVSISARELVFEGEGRIQTTPDERTESPGATNSGGRAGVNGLPAGDIVLAVGEILTDGPGIRFDLSGGRGQPGGPGQHGANGSSISSRWSSVEVCDWPLCKTHTPASGYTIIYWRYRVAGITVEDGGAETAWPTSGTDARPSGKPGEGGAGGSIVSNIPLGDLALLQGGLTPPPTRPATSPFDRYRGGSAGTPTRSEKVNFVIGGFPPAMTSTAYATRTTSAGSDAAIALANTVAGAAGTEQLSDSPFAWVHPLMLRKVLQHIQDDYIGERISAAQERLDDVVAVLTAYRGDVSWDTLDSDTQADLVQIHSELRLLQQRIEAGLDYFGNPAGWVPMLSFEVNQTLFRNELERAMRTLYLTYWIGNKAASEQQRLDALTALRDSLSVRFEEARADYDIAVARLPVLNQQADQIDSAIRTLQGKLEVEELKLLNDLREPDWVLGLRLGLKLSATMCQMVPVYQPALGAVGAGLRVASNFDPDSPWDSITEAGNIGTAYKNSPFNESAGEKKTEAAKVDPAQTKNNSAFYAKSLLNAANGLSAGVEDMNAFIKERESPSEEMLAELERLKSRSPEYKALMEEVEDLMLRNREFADEVVATMQQIGSLSEFMTHALLAIDALGRDIAPAATVLDERATAYLNDLERRAYDRLVKYHYYLAKAYEYRMLRPYTEPLNLEGLIQKFQEIADLNSNHEVTPDQFATFLAVYEDKLAAVAETIFDHYNANRPDRSVPVRFNLLPEEIAALNEGRSFTLNLRDAGFFQPQEENVRIVDLRVFSMEIEPEGTLGRTAFLDLNIEHAGVSRLKKDGKIHQFRHYNQDTQNPFVWGGRYDAIDDQLDPIRPSDASDSLLRSLLSGPAVSDMLLYSRPSAWADLEFSRTYVNSGGGPIRLNSVRLEMVYDFTPRSTGSGLRNLELLVQTFTEGPGGEPVIEDSSFMPYFQLGATDVNGRSDARGSFLRVFQSGGSPIEIVAPETYGQWEFDRWTDRFGADLPGGPFTDPLLPFSLSNDTLLVARYRPLEPAVIDTLLLETPTVLGGSLILEWTGGPGVRLQTRPSLDEGEWVDVPGTEGSSSVSLMGDGNAAFFRLAR